VSRRTLVARILVLLVLIAPAIAQEEERPYFALSSSRTFGARDHPAIALSAYHVEAVQIRVYRVKDPLEFYRKLEDPHSFGMTMPRPAGKRTLIEVVHSWKRGLRADIRRSLRGQFSESPRAHFWHSEQPKPAVLRPENQATYYAEAPLLNQDQLVMSLIQPVTSKTRWQMQQVPLNVRQKGVYLVEATHGALRAYTILSVSDAVLLTKVGRDRILGFVADRYTGEALENTSVFSIVRNGSISEVKTNADGLADIKNTSTAADSARILAVHNNDVAFGEIPNYTYAARLRNWTGYIYTDRPVYRPGDTTHFR
jgi:hypothetical protein